jgi:ribosomal protein L14E/L6E/L27E
MHGQKLENMENKKDSTMENKFELELQKYEELEKAAEKMSEVSKFYAKELEKNACTSKRAPWIRNDN